MNLNNRTIYKLYKYCKSIRVLQKQVYIHHSSSISLIKQGKASMHAKIIKENQEHNK